MIEVDRKRFPHEHAEYFYSDLKVMKSPGGYYLGRSCWEKAGGYEAPLSRDSDYFDTEEEAALALNAGFEVRGAVENEASTLPAPHQPEHN